MVPDKIIPMDIRVRVGVIHKHIKVYRHPPEHNGTYLSELVATIQMGQQVPFQMEGEIIRHPEGIDQDNTGQTADPVEVEPVNILFTPVMVDQMDQKVRTLEKLVLRQGL